MLLQTVLVLIGLVACFVIARINRSNEIFWKLLFCLVVGIVIGTVIGRNSKKQEELTSQQIPISNAFNALVVDTYDLFDKKLDNKTIVSLYSAINSFNVKVNTIAFNTLIVPTSTMARNQPTKFINTS
jgi:hypothetical protein